MKEIRLQKMVTKEEVNEIISLYKTTWKCLHNKSFKIDDFIMMKSMFRRMIVAQEENDDLMKMPYHPRWVEPMGYLNKMRAKFDKQTNEDFMKYLLFLFRNKSVSPFDFKIENDFGKLL